MSGAARLTAIYVHYHAAALLARSLAALRADVASVGLEVEAIVIDNGSTAAEAALLAGLPARVETAGGNVGFAAGVNRGLRSASGKTVLLVNPDARVQAGAVGALIEALRRGASIAGPRLRWTADRLVLLPPAAERSRRAELLRTLGATSDRWGARGRQRWRRRARRHWRAQAPIVSWELSGACLAFDRRVWQAVGPFDEAYRLYFEETDWLARARARGFAAVYVPAAEVVHDVGTSAAAQGQAVAWFEQSAAHFRRRHYGQAFARGVEWLAARRGPPTGSAAAPFPAAGLEVAAGPETWIEMAPDALGWPAAGECVSRSTGVRWTPPEPLRQAAAGRAWTIRRTDSAGRETGVWAFAGAMGGDRLVGS